MLNFFFYISIACYICSTSLFCFFFALIIFGEVTGYEFLCCVSGKRASVTPSFADEYPNTKSGSYWCKVGVSCGQMLSTRLSARSKTGSTFYKYATVMSLESGHRHRMTVLARLDESRVPCAPGG